MFFCCPLRMRIAAPWKSRMSSRCYPHANLTRKKLNYNFFEDFGGPKSEKAYRAISRSQNARDALARRNALDSLASRPLLERNPQIQIGTIMFTTLIQRECSRAYWFNASRIIVLSWIGFSLDSGFRNLQNSSLWFAFVANWLQCLAFP